MLFTLGWFVLEFFSPGFYSLGGARIEPYSAMSQSISGLGVGPTAPFMNTILVLSGVLTVAGVLGMVICLRNQAGIVARRALLALLGLPALSAVMDGVFTLRHNLLHSIGFTMALTSIAGFPICGHLLRRIPSWRRFGSWLIVGGPMTLVLTVTFFVTFSPTAVSSESGDAGLIERILVIEIMAWYVAMGWRTTTSIRQHPALLAGTNDPGWQYLVEEDAVSLRVEGGDLEGVPIQDWQPVDLATIPTVRQDGNHEDERWDHAC